MSESLFYRLVRKQFDKITYQDTRKGGGALRAPRPPFNITDIRTSNRDNKKIYLKYKFQIVMRKLHSPWGKTFLSSKV